MGNACCYSDAAMSSYAEGHLDSHFGAGTSDSLRLIADVLLAAKARLNLEPLANPMLVNLGMVMKQLDDHQRDRTPPTSGTLFDDAKVLEKAARYVGYASAAHNLDGGRKAIVEHIGGRLRAEAIKHVEEEDDLTSFGYFVAVDPDTDDIVLCMCGTDCTRTALRMAITSKERLLGGRAHGQLLEAAKVVVESAAQVLLRLSQQMPRRGIAIVGHGTGGGVATLATILLCCDGCPFAKLMSAGKVKCYCFSPPPTFEPLWALPAWVHGATYTFVHNMDCVPRLCMGTIAKLYLAMRQVDNLPIFAERRLAFLKGDAQIDTTLPDCVELSEEQGFVYASLLVVGTVVTLYRAEGQEDAPVRCELTPAHLMDRIILHPNLVHDHAVSCLDEAFADLRLQLRASEGCVLS